MHIVKGTAEIPFIFSVHHASADFGEFSERCTLNAHQRKAYSDYGSSETVPQNGLGAVIATLSRGIVDLNRSPTDTQQFAQHDFATPANTIWKAGGQLSADEKQKIINEYYEPYHAAVSELAESANNNLSVVVAWDNTADKIIGVNDAGEQVRMPAIILSNNGDEESAARTDGQQTTCDPVLLHLIGEQLHSSLVRANVQADVHYNLVFKGKQVVQAHSQWPTRPNRQSLQIEYSTALTHDQTTLEELPGRIELVRNIAEQALAQAYKQYSLLQ